MKKSILLACTVVILLWSNVLTATEATITIVPEGKYTGMTHMKYELATFLLPRMKKGLGGYFILKSTFSEQCYEVFIHPWTVSTVQKIQVIPLQTCPQDK